MSSSKVNIGKVSLVLAIVAVPFLVLVLVPLLGEEYMFYGPVFFWGLELVAFVLGAIGWRSVFGKAGVAVSVIVSLLLLGWLTPGDVTTTEVTTTGQVTVGEQVGASTE